MQVAAVGTAVTVPAPLPTTIAVQFQCLRIHGDHSTRRTELDPWRPHRSFVLSERFNASYVFDHMHRLTTDHNKLSYHPSGLPTTDFIAGRFFNKNKQSHPLSPDAQAGKG
jgi:hypothetical protein